MITASSHEHGARLIVIHDVERCEELILCIFFKAAMKVAAQG